MGTKITALAATTLCLSLATPITAAHAGDADSITVAGITIPLKPGCVSIAPYRVPLDALTAEVSHYKDRLTAEGVKEVSELLAYSFPTAQGQSFLITGPGTGFELCPPERPSSMTRGYELNAIAVGLPWADVPVSVGVDPDAPSDYEPMPSTLDSTPQTWKTGPKDCFVTGVEGHSRRDVCWNHSVQRESDPDYNYHQFFATASGRRTENGEYMERIWVDADWRPGTAYQARDGMPRPDRDTAGTQDCRTTGTETTDEITVGSGSPVEFGWKRTKSTSHTACDLYQAWNPTGGAVHWATQWKKAQGYGTTGTRNTALNLPVEIESRETRPVVWDLRTGQDINVDVP